MVKEKWLLWLLEYKIFPIPTGVVVIKKKKDGICLCPDCSNAFKDLRFEQYKNLKFRNKSDDV